MSTSGDLDFNEQMMRRAIALARKGEGRVEPNPMVGCVIVRRGRVIGEGCHRRAGGPHAEIEALRTCTTKPRGATAYVSLEPCNHHGRTPPCTSALIEAGIAEVFVAVRDPNPDVRGGGIAALRKAGVTMHEGPCADKARQLLAPYLTRIRLNRPFVIAKWAQSLDGKLATRTGDSKWISSEASRKTVHRLRGRMDAIMVGIGTVRADDPQLTARGVRIKRRAMRVVLDTRLRINPKCRLVGTANETPTLIFAGRKHCSSAKASRLVRRGVEVVPIAVKRGQVAIAPCLAELARRGVTNLLVEGGPTLLTTMLTEKVVDEAWVFVSPNLIGGDRAPSVLGGQGIARMTEAIRPLDVQTHRTGPDICYRIRFSPTPR